MFHALHDGISEFTFANIYLFRQSHNYRLTQVADGTLVLLGRDDDIPFFMLPFALPEPKILAQLFEDQGMMKAASASQQQQLVDLGYRVLPDRDNFDYLYNRQDLAVLRGRNYHKKRNLVKAFITNHNYEARPLREEYVDDAIKVLDQWRANLGRDGDYAAAREALELIDELVLCGGIYYVDKKPVAYALGEELGNVASYLIHFEKAVTGYKGLYQFINKSFASVLPEDYETINREQDLGDQGLRQAKLSYKPAGFIEKFKVYPMDTGGPSDTSGL
ncbi:DUF2156 domain-containing protein [Desulfobulbus rhabdoformis]|uniref:DUF2156 domain-containing protein n=1 Tax=Desulfobulbus rhabdoformis TaxID=34032 RepID=UPI001F0685D2|nr:phosphatidylglycerol lysyltransferase domain-containing protein [Desulfobulbus rhabdoformis]